MKIPGFTGEYSMAVRKQFGGSVPRRGHGGLTGKVSPALPIDPNRHACFNLCRGDLAYEGCMDECMAAFGGTGGGGGGGGTGGGGGGTGGGGRGDLVCGPCVKSGPHRGQQHCILPGVGGSWVPCGSAD
jgi:hypothetical protein